MVRVPRGSGIRHYLSIIFEKDENFDDSRSSSRRTFVMEDGLNDTLVNISLENNNGPVVQEEEQNMERVMRILAENRLNAHLSRKKTRWDDIKERFSKFYDRHYAVIKSLLIIFYIIGGSLFAAFYLIVVWLPAGKIHNS
uniref:Neur_chan_memb domain-containing protein n=1 Tax=Parastrongyloides trichosuri TaxID=131310 RepID=A0A0N4ZMV7_PARTI